MRAPRDTSPEAWSRQLDAYRRMGPDERLRRAFQMSEDVKALARDGIRHQHPDWPASRVDAELVQRLFGRPDRRATPE
ncbi:MAG TPA: hypothetical protein VMQ65_05180 [Candidatus Limnocylindria bacterium]|nr:hypothetical protein [Candidatus Limnocylindria bacterium]